MTCKNCGKYNDDNAKYCSQCGAKIEGYSYEDTEEYKAENSKKDDSDFSLKELDSWPQWVLSLISFFVPILGIIYYALERNRVPVRAKKCLNMSILSIVLIIGIAVSVYVISFIFMVLV